MVTGIAAELSKKKKNSAGAWFRGRHHPGMVGLDDLADYLFFGSLGTTVG